MLYLVFALLLWAVPVQATIFFDTSFETCAASAGNDWPCENWNDFNNETLCTTNRLQVLSGSAFSGSKYIRLTYNGSPSSCQPKIVYPIRTLHPTANSKHLFLRTATRQSCGFQIGSNGATKHIRFRGMSPSGVAAYPIVWLYTYSGNPAVEGSYAINIEAPFNSEGKSLWIVGGPKPICGQWDQVEMEVQINTPGQSNGFVRLYVNNVMVVQSLNWEFVGPLTTSKRPDLQAGAGNPSDWTTDIMEVFLQSGVGTIDYDRVAYGDTRIGIVGSPPPQDTTAPTPPTSVAAQ